MAGKNDKRRYKANIAGKSYTISGHASLPHFKATETLFNKQWTQIQTVAPQLKPLEQAVLLTFNTLSDQLYKQAELDELQKQITSLQSELDELRQSQKSTSKREPKSAITSIIDDAKHDSQVRSTNKLFKQDKNT
ncbi:cell division protein ZapA [Leuconostoc carnosum]|uniref:cell division protein ZapA n=1 Tax=Leuconostoc carnosum TaxID=1252 RepID=UPI00123B91F1|nr:cell division protein ZapA [Leuconostoc carnosum]KAA8369720.1 cell division protein ZapA [Leuconostoc carnosum]KAA8380712.1 cell division protein ZapA [Leuconostoc carnosum]